MVEYPRVQAVAETRAFASADAIRWESLRQWVEAETGMDFAGNRLPRLREAVRRVLSRERAAVDLDRLLAHPGQHAPFLDRLTAELTVGESFFFRNEHHFRALREYVIPAILRDSADGRILRVWSAGCATGEEPYSVAILLDQVLGGHVERRASILGTDLNPNFLEQAREACYRSWSFRQTNIHENGVYFARDRDQFRLAARIHECVRFAYLNLVKDVYPSTLNGTLGLDLILFRNVAIYLKPEVTGAILGHFRAALRPGGWLLLGEAEVSLAPAGQFEVRRFDQATFHQKPRDGAEVRPGLAAGLSVPVLATHPLGSGDPMPAGSSTRNRAAPPASPARGTAGRRAETAAAARAPVPSGRVLPEEQVARFAAGRRFEEAERSLQRIVNTKDRARARLRYAQALLACAEIGRARRMLVLSLEENPLSIEAQLLLASFAEEMGDLNAAEQACRRALYVDRKCPIAHFHLAMVQQQKGDHAGARRSFATTLKLIESEAPDRLVSYGEGICYGRLQEMVTLLMQEGSGPR